MPPDLKVKPGETKRQYRERVTVEVSRMEKDRWYRLKRGEIPVVMDVDDFGFLLPGYDDLLKLKKSLPDLKITCFTIPLPKEFFTPANAKHFKTEKYKEWAKIVNELGWIEIAFHGFAHTHHEMEITYDAANEMLQATENFFDQVGLKYKKIFKAPYWQYSYDALMALNDRGYVIALDRNYQRPAPEGSKTYTYNWSFEEVLQAERVVKGHGHFTGRNKNNIGQVLDNILKTIPDGAEFLFISEYIEKYGNKEIS